MTETKELVATTDLNPIVSVMGITPRQMLDGAVQIANDLTQILRAKKLTQKFGAGEHVLVEGWQLSGSMLGFTVREGSLPIEHQDGSFTAVAELFHPASGRVVATASGYCGKDEKAWALKPKYARRSMAITRANGRVYRNNFAWLIKLAGFETSLAEEMPEPTISPDLLEVYDPEHEHLKRWMMRQFETAQMPRGRWGELSTTFTGMPKHVVLQQLAAIADKYHGRIES